ncbi:hypothetical protein C1H46_005364 [Malus baccata]|uniref:Replication protein A OB domain-containing protein n=1 Tax=Malus baccata TaxID=106549 RepID=A0A540ND71_MALBA|nr:hypothetical protein C1H46_005364 [Malus baccata]
MLSLQPTEEVTVQNTRIAKKRNLNLQNIRGKTVRITLYGEAATSFEDNGIQSLLPPVFVALTSLKVKQYQGNPVLRITGSTVCVFNPDIPQFSQYKQKFEHLRSIVRILPTSAEMYTGRAVGPNYESKTIDELLLLDHVLHKNASFACQATVVGFDLTRDWWYKSCLSCHKAVKKMSGSFECNEHGLLNSLLEPCTGSAMVLHSMCIPSRKNERCEICETVFIWFKEMSPEACEHATKNEMLPLRVVVQVLFAGQLQLWVRIIQEVQGSDERSTKQAAEENEAKLDVGEGKMRIRNAENEHKGGWSLKESAIR